MRTDMYSWKIEKLNPSSDLLSIDLLNAEGVVVAHDLILDPFFKSNKSWEKKIKKYKKYMLDHELLLVKASCIEIIK